MTIGIGIIGCGKIAQVRHIPEYEAKADLHNAGEIYRIRAGRIIDRVISWAEDNDYRIPEHFTKDWMPDLDKKT